MLRQESVALQKLGYAVLRNRVDRYGNTTVEGLARGEKKLETPRCGRDDGSVELRFACRK